MTPVDQLIPHDPARGLYGDCLRACVASLLELPCAAVPHVCDGPQPVSWQRDLNRWLAPRGLGLLLCVYSGTDWPWICAAAGVDVYHLIGGPSPRDPAFDHCVVGRNGLIVHDPSPGRRGLGGPPTDVGFLIQTSTKEENL